MRVILAEKPDMGKNIAQALGIKKTNRGFIELSNGDIVTWAIGHLIRLKTPDAYPQYKKWSLDTLPIIPHEMEFEVDPSKSDQLQIIKSLLLKSTTCIIATDPGREGEWIARTILNYCSYRGKLLRLWIDDLTPETIIQGFDRLLDGNDTYLLGEAARVRAYADYWMGFTATRYFSLKATEITKEKVLLSAGRVQTPTLRIVYDREIAIDQFVSQPFYSLECIFSSDQGRYTGRWFRQSDEGIISRVESKAEVESLHKKITNNKGHVLSVETKDIRRQAPQLLHSTSIKVEARKSLGFSIQKTVKVLQAVYDKGCCTYPRTSSRHLSENKAGELLSHLNQIKQSSTLSSIFPEYLQPLQGNKRFVDNMKATEHHAIVPTNETPADKKGTDKELTKDEELLYNLILTHTLAAHYPEGIDQQTEVITRVLDESFISKSISVVKLGWRSILNFNSEEGESDLSLIKDMPILQGNELVRVSESKIHHGKTTPPKRFADTDLEKVMENAGQIVDDEAIDSEVLQELKEKGIGTPATRTDVIDELIKREYIQIQKNLIYLTSKGRHFMDLVHDHPIASIELTGEFEKKLGLVVNGKCSSENLLREFRVFTHELLNMGSVFQEKLVPKIGEKPVFQQVDSVGSCPSCHKPILVRKGFYGCSGYQEGCKFSIPGTYMKGRVTERMARELLEGRKVRIKLTGQYGDYELLLNMKDGKIESRKPTINDLSLGNCLLCGNPVLEKENLFGCSGYRSGCRFSIPKEFLQKKISAAQIKKLLKNGKTDIIKGFIGSKGSFDAALSYDGTNSKIVFTK